VLAATQVQRQIARYNHGRRQAGYRQVRVGIGLHYGTLMLGTIGTVDQMQTTSFPTTSTLPRASRA